MIQAIKYKCCDKHVAACIEPECYTDKEWLKDLRKYVLKGHKVEMVERGNLRFDKCTCEDKDNLFKELGNNENL